MDNQKPKVKVSGNLHRTAPPLTDELLAKYRSMIDTVPARTHVREALEKCYACALKWWNLPESKGSGMIVPLDAEIAEALWDDIPYEEEILTFKKLFNELDAAENARHTEAVNAWQKAATNAIKAKHNLIGYVDLPKSLIERCVQWLGLQSDDIKALLARVTACKAETSKAMSEKRYDGYPYPVRPTLLSHVAGHLLWHVCELNLDREPITNDKI